jgi:hypothetical protein
LGEYKEAHEKYGKTLEMDPYNPIAQKNIRKLEAMMMAKERVGTVSTSINVDLFTEEPGKSALTLLEQINKKETLRVAPGDPVDMEIDGGALRCRTARGVMLGEVETKIARRLIPLMQAGNKYKAAVAKVTADNAVEVMIRETYQAPENARKASFPLTKSLKREDFRPYAKESLLLGDAMDEVEMDEEEEEEAAEEEASEAKPAAEGEVAKPEGAEGIEETPLDDEEKEEKEEKESDQREEDKF